jgi:hypothetical protein
MAVHRSSAGVLQLQAKDRSWPILLKKSLRGFFDSLARKSTSQIGLQTAREHRSRVRRPPKTSLQKQIGTFSTVLTDLCPPRRPPDGADSTSHMTVKDCSASSNPYLVYLTVQPSAAPCMQDKRRSDRSRDRSVDPAGKRAWSDRASLEPMPDCECSGAMQRAGSTRLDSSAR